MDDTSSTTNLIFGEPYSGERLLSYTVAVILILVVIGGIILILLPHGQGSGLRYPQYSPEVNKVIDAISRPHRGY